MLNVGHNSAISTRLYIILKELTWWSPGKCYPTSLTLRRIKFFLIKNHSWEESDIHSDKERTFNALLPIGTRIWGGSRKEENRGPRVTSEAFSFIVCSTNYSVFFLAAWASSIPSEIWNDFVVTYENDTWGSPRKTYTAGTWTINLRARRHQ